MPNSTMTPQNRRTDVKRVHRVQVWLSDPEYEALKLLAIHQDRPMAGVLRKALRVFLHQCSGGKR